MESLENVDNEKGKSRKDLLAEYQAKKQLYAFRTAPSLPSLHTHSLSSLLLSLSLSLCALTHFLDVSRQ